MSIEATVWELTKGLAGERVYPDRLPEDVDFPAIAFLGMAGSPIQNQESFKRNPRYQFDVWARTYEDMVNTSAEVVKTLDHYNDGETSILLIMERDMPDQTTGLYRKILEFYIWGN